MNSKNLQFMNQRLGAPGLAFETGGTRVWMKIEDVGLRVVGC
jgi:hypothetical protein